MRIFVGETTEPPQKKPKSSLVLLVPLSSRYQSWAIHGAVVMVVVVPPMIFGSTEAPLVFALVPVLVPVVAVLPEPVPVVPVLVLVLVPVPVLALALALGEDFLVGRPAVPSLAMAPPIRFSSVARLGEVPLVLASGAGCAVAAFADDIRSAPRRPPPVPPPRRARRCVSGVCDDRARTWTYPLKSP